MKLVVVGVLKGNDGEKQFVHMTTSCLTVGSACHGYWGKGQLLDFLEIEACENFDSQNKREQLRQKKAKLLEKLPSEINSAYTLTFLRFLIVEDVGFAIHVP